MFVDTHRRQLTPIPSLHLLVRLQALDHRLRRSTLYPLFIALISCAVWLIATQIIRMIGFGGFYGVPVALGAVIFAAWAAGTSAGLITAGLSVILLHELLPSMRMLEIREESAWHLTVFTLVALIMSGFQAAVREQRLRAQREKQMRDEFLAIVSHELRTPVTIISGSANLLSRLWESMNDDDRQELLVSLQDESARISRMIEDLLLLARIEDDPGGANEPILLGPAVARSMQTFRRLNSHRAVLLEQPEERLIVQGRDVYVDAVLRNVLSNAHRFSPIDEPIEVKVGHNGSTATVLIRDHGPGVSKKLLDEIYQPYFRSQPLSDGTRGIGLGLTLCKRAMEAMGGRISAETLDSGGLEVTLKFRLEREGG
jgi:K+-sensing histidine kinase KdpD